MSKIIQVIRRAYKNPANTAEGRLPFLNPSTLTLLDDVLMIPTSYSIWVDRGEVQFKAEIFASSFVFMNVPNGALLKYTLTAKANSTNVVIGFVGGNETPVFQNEDIRDQLDGVELRMADSKWKYDISFSQTGLTSMLNVIESSTKTNPQTGEALNPVPKLSDEWSDELWYLNCETGELSQTFTQWL